MSGGNNSPVPSSSPDEDEHPLYDMANEEKSEQQPRQLLVNEEYVELSGENNSQNNVTFYDFAGQNTEETHNNASTTTPVPLSNSEVVYQETPTEVQEESQLLVLPRRGKGKDLKSALTYSETEPPSSTTTEPPYTQIQNKGEPKPSLTNSEVTSALQESEIETYLGTPLTQSRGVSSRKNDGYDVPQDALTCQTSEFRRRRRGVQPNNLGFMGTDRGDVPIVLSEDAAKQVRQMVSYLLDKYPDVPIWRETTELLVALYRRHERDRSFSLIQHGFDHRQWHYALRLCYFALPYFVTGVYFSLNENAGHFRFLSNGAVVSDAIQLNGPTISAFYMNMPVMLSLGILAQLALEEAYALMQAVRLYMWVNPWYLRISAVASVVMTSHVLRGLYGVMRAPSQPFSETLSADFFTALPVELIVGSGFAFFSEHWRQYHCPQYSRFMRSLIHAGVLVSAMVAVRVNQLDDSCATLYRIDERLETFTVELTRIFGFPLTIAGLCALLGLALTGSAYFHSRCLDERLDPEAFLDRMVPDSRPEAMRLSRAASLFQHWYSRLPRIDGVEASENEYYTPQGLSVTERETWVLLRVLLHRVYEVTQSSHGDIDSSTQLPCRERRRFLYQLWLSPSVAGLLSFLPFLVATGASAAVMQSLAPEPDAPQYTFLRATEASPCFKDPQDLAPGTAVYAMQDRGQYYNDALTLIGVGIHALYCQGFYKMYHRVFKDFHIRNHGRCKWSKKSLRLLGLCVGGGLHYGSLFWLYLLSAWGLKSLTITLSIGGVGVLTNVALMALGEATYDFPPARRTPAKSLLLGLAFVIALLSAKDEIKLSENLFAVITDPTTKPLDQVITGEISIIGNWLASMAKSGLYVFSIYEALFLLISLKQHGKGLLQALKSIRFPSRSTNIRHDQPNPLYADRRSIASAFTNPSFQNNIESTGSDEEDKESLLSTGVSTRGSAWTTKYGTTGSTEQRSTTGSLNSFSTETITMEGLSGPFQSHIIQGHNPGNTKDKKEEYGAF